MGDETQRALAKLADEQSLEIFDPERHRLKVAALEYTADEAKRIKDWPKLEAAIDAKIEEQHRFVAWWHGNVTVGHGGDRKPDQVPRTRDLITMRDAEKLTGMPNQRVSDLGKHLQQEDQYRVRLLGAEYRAAMLEVADSQSIQQSLSVEHYTPGQYIEAARKVLGDIDLDPATSDLAQETVQAINYFTVEDDGLVQEWHGRVWLNPPYGKNPGPAPFIAKLMREMKESRVSAAIVLVNAHCTDASWFQNLWDGILCFTDHRINFSGDDSRSGSTHGSVFVYFGPDQIKFIEEFSRFGAILARVTP